MNKAALRTVGHSHLGLTKICWKIYIKYSGI